MTSPRQAWLARLLASAAVCTAAAQIGCGGLAEPLMFEVVPASLDLKVGETAQLQIVVNDANGELVTDRTVSYESQNPAVVTVSTTGLVTALSSGTTTIALSAEGVSGSVPVTVIPTMSGSWSGTFSIPGGVVTLSMTVIEGTSGSVTGTGSFSAGGVGLPINITGTHSHPNINLTLASPDPNIEPARLTGQFTGDTAIACQLFDSGFTGEPVTLLRQSSASANVALTDVLNGNDLATAILALPRSRLRQ